jgi:hypothetical protein
MSTEQVSLASLFEAKLAERVNEDFRIGEAAKALHTLNKASQEFTAFVSGDFAKILNGMHQDPRRVEEDSGRLQKMLDDQRQKLNTVVDQLDDYIMSLDMYTNPKSVNHDTHRQDYRRWDRYK